MHQSRFIVTYLSLIKKPSLSWVFKLQVLLITYYLLALAAQTNQREQA